MNRFASSQARNIPAALLVMALLAATSIAHAAPASAPASPSTNDEESLEKGAVADVKPPQKYQTAIREAGGAFKEALRECAQASDGDRLVCAAEVRATYDREMAQAKLLFRGRELLQACVRG
ncbi:MAG: hypothetical protein IPP88_09145 [Betaproteobacteria bacterium]|nr:hypothetical protein [Betaproteobacteria bacterium]